MNEVNLKLKVLFYKLEIVFLVRLVRTNVAVSLSVIHMLSEFFSRTSSGIINKPCLCIDMTPIGILCRIKRQVGLLEVNVLKNTQQTSPLYFACLLSVKNIFALRIRTSARESCWWSTFRRCPKRGEKKRENAN